MTTSRGSSNDPSGPGQYRISVEGHLAQRWAGWFDGLRLTNESDGTTVLQGVVIDQAALHGLLAKVRDTGLPLVSVTRMDTGAPDTSTGGPRRPRPDCERPPPHQSESSPDRTTHSAPERADHDGGGPAAAVSTTASPWSTA